MTIEQTQKILATVLELAGGEETNDAMIIVFPDSDRHRPTLITNIPEEYLKRVIRKFAIDVCVNGNTEVRVGDEIAFDLEARPKSDEQTNA